MINILLYRGGMCGDLLGSMIDPSIYKKISVIDITDDNNLFSDSIKKSRIKLKKFWNYSNSYKLNYCNKFKKLSKTVILLSHDTDFSYNFFSTDSFQIVCKNEKLIKLFSARFYVLHKNEIIHQVSNSIKSNNDFINDYYNDIINWQNYYKFDNIIDISNIYDKKFIDDLYKIFNYINIDRARQLHNAWLINEEKNIDLYYKYL